MEGSRHGRAFPRTPCLFLIYNRFIKIKRDTMTIAATTDPLPIQIEPANRLLTAAEFQTLR